MKLDNILNTFLICSWCIMGIIALILGIFFNLDKEFALLFATLCWIASRIEVKK